MRLINRTTQTKSGETSPLFAYLHCIFIRFFSKFSREFQRNHGFFQTFSPFFGFLHLRRVTFCLLNCYILLALLHQATLDLLEKFYRAGFPEDVIFDAINQVMLLRSATEIYSTVDFCLLDLVSGEARFIKIGAPPSFIIRRGRVLTVLSPTLPLGIMESVTPGGVRRVLEDGDMVVMVSDGVCSELDAAWMEEILPKIDCDDPQRLAQMLTQCACDQFGRRDDMTVLAAKVRLPKGTHINKKGRKRLVHWRARVESA